MQIFNEHLEWSFIVHTYHCTVKSQNLWNQVQGKNVLSIGLWRSEHDIEIPAQKQHAHNGAPGSPIKQKCHFFQALSSKKLDNGNNNNMQRITTQIVCNKIFFMLLFEWTN